MLRSALPSGELVSKIYLITADYKVRHENSLKLQGLLIAFSLTYKSILESAV